MPRIPIRLQHRANSRLDRIPSQHPNQLNVDRLVVKVARLRAGIMLTRRGRKI
jgi:hypothetical protein